MDLCGKSSIDLTSSLVTSRSSSYFVLPLEYFILGACDTKISNPDEGSRKFEEVKDMNGDAVVVGDVSID